MPTASSLRPRRDRDDRVGKLARTLKGYVVRCVERNEPGECFIRAARVL
jgi:hypothetical protein